MTWSYYIYLSSQSPALHDIYRIAGRRKFLRISQITGYSRNIICKCLVFVDKDRKIHSSNSRKYYSQNALSHAFAKIFFRAHSHYTVISGQLDHISTCIQAHEYKHTPFSSLDRMENFLCSITQHCMLLSKLLWPFMISMAWLLDMVGCRGWKRADKSTLGAFFSGLTAKMPADCKKTQVHTCKGLIN